MIGLFILTVLCVYALYFAYTLLTNPDNIFWLMKLGLGLGCLLLLWMNVFKPSKDK
jgi:hypothetical protein